MAMETISFFRKKQFITSKLRWAQVCFTSDIFIEFKIFGHKCAHELSYGLTDPVNIYLLSTEGSLEHRLVLVN